MATVTGTLKDFALQSLAPYRPRLIFKASTVGVVGGDLFATRPVVVIPNSVGEFEVELQPTAELQNVVHYTLAIDWLDASGRYVTLDLPKWKITVPADGGNLGDLINAPVNTALTWVDETPPVNPTVGQLWLVPSTGDLYEWEN